MQNRRGFTLIELLVVIAIVAILAAILFPVFTAAKERGKQMKCMSNMRQLSMALIRYTDDWRGATPLPCIDGWPWDHDTWRERVQPYCKSKGVLQCPSPNVDTRYYPGNAYMKYNHYGLAYGLTHENEGAIIPPSGTGHFGYTYISRIQQPSKTIMVAENKDGDWSVEPMTATAGSSNGPGAYYPYHLKSGKGSVSNEFKDYDGGGNFIFCDGHAQYMTVAASEANDCYLWKVDKTKKG